MVAAPTGADGVGGADNVRAADRRRWWTRPDARVGLLAAVVALATGAVFALLVRSRFGSPEPGGGLAWELMLVLLFAATEGFVVHLRVRRGGHALGLGDIPTVLALLTLQPSLVIVARVVGGGAGLLARGQRGTKLAFNVALVGAQAALAAVVFHLAAGGAGHGIRVWLASYAATISADVVAVVLITAVIALHEDPGEWRRLPAAMRTVPFVAVTTSVALIGSPAAGSNKWAMLSLTLVAVVLFLAYQAFVQQGQGKTEIEQLYAFTRELDGAGDLADLVAVVLDRVRDQVRAGTAELVVPEPDELRRTRVSDSAGPRTTRHAGDGADEWFAPALAGRPLLASDTPEGNAMAVPVRFGDVTGALVVRESLPDAGPFSPGRLRLFHALANHAGVAFGRAVVLDRLRREGAEKEYLASHDSLTGLPNRHRFQQLLDEALAARRPAAVLVLDVDRFKEVNDALGHETGDALLTEVARRLRDTVRAGGAAARMGGDEFAVWLPTDGSVEAGLARGAEVAAILERPVRIGPMTVDLRASIGVAAAPVDGLDGQTLIRHADVAMYGAKQRRCGLRAYDPVADVNTPHRLARIADLRQAVEERELMVVFQPKVDPASGAVVGAEALSRWHHPVDGLIPPDEFIPLAEHSGLIRQLTTHVLELALRRQAAWTRAGHRLHVAVNLSPNSLLDHSLPELVERLLAQTGTTAASLTLEITENMLMSDPQGAHATLERLHALGVRLSIDDFGTGYSSLSRLRRLPIHEVKIDKSFVRRLAVDHRDRAVVRSAVQLGHALDLEVVAEGVEDREAYAYLAEEGCDVVQGFFVSRPLAPDAFERWLAQRPAQGRPHTLR